jgi:hypothetical protein
MRNLYDETWHDYSGTRLLSEKVVHENPHDTIDPKGLRHEVWNIPVPQSMQRNGSATYPDCMQTGMHAKGALIPLKTQLPGLERRQNSVMSSRKTVWTVRDEDESGAKVRTSYHLRWRVCQGAKLGGLVEEDQIWTILTTLLPLTTTVPNFFSVFSAFS